MALSPNAQSALIQGIFSGVGTLGQALAQRAQNKTQEEQFQQQFQRGAAGDLLAAEPLGGDAAFQAKRRAQQAILQQLIAGGVRPASAGIAEHMPIDNLDLSGLVGPLSDQATSDALTQRHSDLDLIRRSIQYSGNPAALAASGGGGFNAGGLINAGMGALDLYKGFGGKLPSFFGNASSVPGATAGVGNVLQAGSANASSLYTPEMINQSQAIGGAATTGIGAKATGLTGKLKAGGVGGIMGGFATAMAIRNGQVGSATLNGAMTGLKYGGPLGAAIGGGVGLVGSLIAKHQNATKGDREDFVKKLGYKDLGSFNNFLSTLGPEGQALRTFGESVVGKHDKAQNAEWLNRAQALLSRPQQARLY